ncbi:MAG TPA: peptidylprolyl isomerase [Stellaceae bacterium]|nr:peptidylprolyl isomerase [Stellaceae bacterium]
MRLISVFCLVFLLAGSAVAQETRIAAIVNDEVISLNDLSNRMQLVMRSSGMEDTPQNRSRIQPQILRSLIDEKLQMQEAKRLNVTVTPEELDQAFARIEQQNNMTKGALDDFLKESGVPRSTLADQLSASIAWGKLVRNRLMQDVTISDEEVTEALNQLKQEADVPQNRVSEIFLAVDAPGQDEDAKRLADRLIDQIRGGANFAAVAQQFSQSPSAAVGGDIGWVTSAQLSPEIGGAIDKMKPGEMSYPIRTPAGYYLLYLRERRKLGQPNPDDTVLSLVEVAFGLSPMATAEEQQRVTAEAQQVSSSAKSCGELAKLGRDKAPQATREIPSIKAGDLPAQVREVALSLGVAEASKPIAIPGGVGVIMVCERKDPPGGLPTRDEITEQLGRTRLDALARRYLRDLRRGAYVDIRG